MAKTTPVPLTDAQLQFLLALTAGHRKAVYTVFYESDAHSQVRFFAELENLLEEALRTSG